VLERWEILELAVEEPDADIAQRGDALEQVEGVSRKWATE
jgi:hypothetical protein